MSRSLVVVSVGLACTAALLPGPRSLLVSDFEGGLGGWWTNDPGFNDRTTPTTTLISIERCSERSGGHSLRIRFHRGEGWASAAVNFSDEGDDWADAGVDEIRLRVRGDGSDKKVTMGVQAWADDLVTPVMFELPVSLSRTDWHTVTLTCADLEASRPNHRLRLRSLISFQVNGSGALGPADVWIDDVEAVGAHGAGARFAESPLADRVRTATAPAELPRLGNWAYPGRDGDALRQCKELGIGFSSNGDSAVQQQRVFLEGIVSSHSIGRPSGADLMAGLGLADSDVDQDAQGNRSSEGVVSAIFEPAAVDRFTAYVRRKARARRSAPWVKSFVLSSPVSMYGEVHYPASTAGGYLVFGGSAGRNFRAWLKHAYKGDLAALSRAWGVRLTSWDEARPPAGPVDSGAGLDTRQSWSDFTHWYNGWLEEVSLRTLRAVRAESSKPVALMLGGPKIGLSQGICLGNIGPIARMLGRHKPAFLSDTDSQTLFSCRYSRAACSQYGINLMLEHVGPPHLQAFHQVNTVHNVLACGGDYVHLATLGELFDPKHWFHSVWRQLAPELLSRRTGYVRSDAAMFHSYVTSWYRPSRSNGDCVSLYDTSNTLWFWDKGYPSWGRALGSPDVVDDAMVADGGLAGRKLLVIPNTGVTVTTREAARALRRWVTGGGRLVAFGRGCLEYVVEPNRSLRRMPYVAGMLRALDVERAPGGSVIERRWGKGTVVFDTRAVDPASAHAQACMEFLSDQSVRSGARVWCRARPGWDANLMYGGRDSMSGRHLFVLDLTRRARNGPDGPEFWKGRTFELSFDPSLAGDAEVIAVTDSFAGCRGAEATYDAPRRVLVLKFRLPARIVLDV